MASDDTIGTVRRVPTLLVALGGTGMRTARYALWLAGRSGDAGLRDMVQTGQLQVVAVDTDWKANREDVFVEDYVVPTVSAQDGRSRQEHRRLPRVPRVVLVKTEDITRAVQAIRSRHRGRTNGHHAGKEEENLTEMANRWARRNGMALEDCLSWLPQVDPRAGEEISPGQARYEGAGQWRPLGRVGLFLEARAILDELREGYRRVRDSTPSGRPVRVHIVCSLSGGTGSGMFWDIACLLRHIDASCTITGNFLLAEPFRGADRAERIEANAYAALKELAVYKNLQQSRPFEVLYPIGPSGLRFRREPNDPSLFDYVYVYQGFAPRIQTSQVGDVNEAAIETSCFRLAQNIMAQMRDDVRARIDEGANNERSDTNAVPGHPERGYVFSTSAVADLELMDATQLGNTLESAFLHSIRDRLIGRERPMMTDNELAMLMFSPLLEAIRHMVAADGSVSSPAEGADATITLPADVERNLEAGTVSFPMTVSEENFKTALETTRRVAEHRVIAEYKSIRRMLDGLTALERKADDLDLIGDEVRRQVIALYNDNSYVAPKLREAWNARMLSPEWKDGKPPKDNADPVIATIDIADFLHDDAMALWRSLEQGIVDARNAIKDRGASLSQATRQVINDWRRQMDRSWERKEIPTVEIAAPGSLVQLRPALDLLRHQQDRELIDQIRKSAHYGPMGRMLKQFAVRLGQELNAIANKSEVRNGIGPAFAGYIDKNRATIKDTLKCLLDQADASEALMRERADRVLSIGYGPLASVFQEAEEYYERFEHSTAGTLIDALGRLKNDETQRTINDAAERIARLAESTAREVDRNPQALLARDFQATEEQVKLWRTLLDTLSDKIAALGMKTEERFILRLSRCLEEHFCLPWSAEDAKDPERFEHRLTRMRIVFKTFVRYWAEQEDFILARMGGEDGLRGLLENCRSRVFGKGSIAPSIQQDKLVIGKPLVTEGALDRRAASRNRLEQTFRDAAQAVMNQPPTFCREPSSRPIVYHEQLYRAGAEIVGIERYHQSYISVPEEQRALHHFIPEAAGLSDLMDSSLQPRTQQASWTCPDLAHEHTHIPWNQPICPACLEEYNSGVRPLRLVNRRNPRETPLPCPGCEPEHPRMIPPSMIRFLFDGVMPNELPAFEKLTEQLDLDVACRHGSSLRHMIFPVLEETVNGKRRRHYLYREHGGFRSTKDATLIEHSCFHCGYPITARQLEAIRDGRKVCCPRCQRELRECLYCSHRDNALFQPTGSSGEPDRCPRCSNLMHRHTRDYDPNPEEGLAMPGFCRNIFGCPAGGRPWSSAAAMDRVIVGDGSAEWCDACHDHDDPGLLLPWEDLRSHIERCPICLTLIGLPDNGIVHRLKPDELAAHLRNRHEDEPDRHCVLCGTEPGAVIQWMLSSDYFDQSDTPIPTAHIGDLKDRYTGRYTMPELDAVTGFEILEQMWRYHDDRKLFDAVRAISGIIGPKRRFADLERDLRRLFTDRSLTQRVVGRRLSGLTRIEDDIRARQEGRPGQTPGSADQHRARIAHSLKS
ncbi:tubulin-like doman-containing protein [Azospirillum sp. HJ39]|uniref:tubulin-like doman-containing protein n=1 Tax=Azospirillum sp. HJ39 TaxID=3159496 RepID=UPI00355689CA